MDAPFPGSYGRQSLGSGGHGETEEEMQHMLQFLDSSIITPPSVDESTPQQSVPRTLPAQQQLTVEQLQEMSTLHEAETGSIYNELGEVIDLLGSLDANDSDPALQHRQQETFGAILQQKHQRYSETGYVNSTGNNGTGLTPTELPRATASIDQKVHLPRSTSVSSNQSGVDSISPVGLLGGGPSMSPATINWLQSLVPSTSSESLSGLISPATLYGAAGGSTAGLGGSGIAGANGVDGLSAKSGGIPRTPSCEIIDWKAYNDACGAGEKSQKEPAKWRVIPQHGPHADPVASSAEVGKPPELSAEQQMELAAKKIAEEKNKRKALVSPEYVQYGNAMSSVVGVVPGEHGSAVKNEAVQYATKVPEPTGRRPFKKSLHQTTVSAAEPALQYQQQQQQNVAPSISSVGDAKDDSIRCKCTGKCRNARCACVKAGMVCGAQCKCVSCANPFVPMAREGIDIQLMVQDICLMQYLSKVKDMQELLDSTVNYECCEGGGGAVQVKHTVEHGFSCPHCGAHFTYSWCNNRLCPDAKKPRRHCAKCRRCGDHRNQHCDLCNHCYFAGVANSFRCSCQTSGGGGGAKSRAVVPNPVRREAEPVTSSKHTNGDQHNEQTQLFGVENPLDENATTQDDEAADSCKMQ